MNTHQHTWGMVRIEEHGQQIQKVKEKDHENFGATIISATPHEGKTGKSYINYMAVILSCVNM